MRCVLAVDLPWRRVLAQQNSDTRDTRHEARSFAGVTVHEIGSGEGAHVFCVSLRRARGALLLLPLCPNLLCRLEQVARILVGGDELLELILALLLPRLAFPLHGGLLLVQLGLASRALPLLALCLADGLPVDALQLHLVPKRFVCVVIRVRRVTALRRYGGGELFSETPGALRPGFHSLVELSLTLPDTALQIVAGDPRDGLTGLALRSAM
jgi:hypothetical protein